MNRIGKLSLLIVLAIGLGAGVVFGINLNQPAAAQGAGTPSHTVVATDGMHLIVTDNKANTLYYYSIEKDAEIGSDLKLRGSVDLTQVGKETITPKVTFKRK